MATAAAATLTRVRRLGIIDVLGLVLLAAAIVFLIDKFFDDPTRFFNVGVIGLTNGAIYGVVAIGYTLVYGILQLINFAHGDVFALSGLVASTVILSVLSLDVNTGAFMIVVGLTVTLLITVPMFAAINATIERIAYKPLRRAPRLAPLITAVGVSFVVQNISLAIYGVDFRSVPNFIPRTAAITIGDVVIQWNKLAVFIIIVPVLVALTWFVRATRQGKAMRAVAQDRDASAMLGIDVNRTISVTFMLAGGLAAVAGLVYLLQFNLRYDTGFELGLIAFTAAVLGGIGNLPGAVLGAMVIGLVQAFNEGLDGTPGSDWTRTMVFGILILILVFRPQGILGERTPEGSMTPSFADRFRTPEAKRNGILVGGLTLFGVIYPFIDQSLQDLPLIGDFVPRTGSVVVMLVVTMMAIGLNIVVGYAGLLDLGYVAFYAAGAYMAGWLASVQFEQTTLHLGSTVANSLPGIHISMWLVMILAGVFTTVVGILIGLPTLRLRGDYLAIVTLGFGEIVPQFVRNADSLGGFDLTNGTFGISPIDSLGFGDFVFRTERNSADLYYWTAIVLLLATVFCSVRLRDSRLGRAWVAIREDETAAGAMGIPLMRTKTWSYAIGAFFGGVAGAFYASFKAGAFPADFFFNFSIFLLCMVILGGMGSVWGVILGGMILGYLNIEGLATIGSKVQDAGVDFDPTKYQFGIYGVIIVAMMLFRPTGLIPERRHKIEMEEGVHDTPFYDVQTEGSDTDRDRTDD